MVQLMILKYEESQALRLLKFAFLDMTAMILFVAFLGLGLRSIRRKQVGDHLRYMGCTALFALEPLSSASSFSSCRAFLGSTSKEAARARHAVTARSDCRDPRSSARRRP